MPKARPARSRLRRTVWLCALVINACALLWLMRSGAGSVGSSGESGRVAAQAREPEPTSARAQTTTGVRHDLATPLPETFDGSELDGGFVVDAHGNLVPSRSALALFNYFFSASGQESDGLIVARIEDQIRRRLKPPALGQALRLLHAFVAYRDAGRELAEQLVDAGPEERIDRVYALRRETFGPETAERLFAHEEAVRAVHVERWHVLHDESLSPEERAQALRAVESDLPEGLRVRRAHTVAAMRAHHETNRLRAEGASEEEVSRVRRDLLGEAAAQRLAALDREEQQFQAALDELEALWERTPREAGPLRDQELDELVNTRFEPRDRARARALLLAGAARP